MPACSTARRLFGRLLLAGALALTTLTPALGADEEQKNSDAQHVKRARDIFQLLATGKYEEFVATGDETIREKFPASQAALSWTGILARLGMYKSIEEAKLLAQDAYYPVQFLCRFERGTLRMRIVLDNQGRLSGLWFDEVAPDWEPPAYVDKTTFQEEEVTVSAGQFPLPGTLSLPRAAGPYPAVVLVHGSGPNNRDEVVGACQPFRDLAWGLASRGIVVLRYDKRTLVHPYACAVDEWTPDNEVIEDALAAVQLLRQRPEVKPERVFIIGHSMGAWATPLIALHDRKLAGGIMLAGNARSVLDLIEDQLDYQVKLALGMLTAEQRKLIADAKAGVAAIRAGKTETVTEPILGAPAVCWERLHQIDPTAVAAQLETPLFIIQGGRDYQVTKEDFELWQQRLKNRDNVTYKYYRLLNHVFVKGLLMSTPAEYLTPGHVDGKVIEDIATWVKARPPQPTSE